MKILTSRHLRFPIRTPFEVPLANIFLLALFSLFSAPRQPRNEKQLQVQIREVGRERKKSKPVTVAIAKPDSNSESSNVSPVFSSSFTMLDSLFDDVRRMDKRQFFYQVIANRILDTLSKSVNRGRVPACVHCTACSSH